MWKAAFYLWTGLCVALGFELFGEQIRNVDDPYKYKDCDELMHRGLYKDEGAYMIYLNSSEPIKVFCRFENGVAYTPIMTQKFGNETFRRPYQQYMYGFGYGADFWLGLMKMNTLTDSGYLVLRVTLQDWNHVIKVLQYTHFHVGPWSQQFPLSIGGYVSGHVLPDDFSHNNGMLFATYDKPDRHQCAINQKAGWWYNYCTYTLPTGFYYHTGGPYTPSGPFYDGIYYSDWLGFGYSLKYIRLELSRTLSFDD